MTTFQPVPIPTDFRFNDIVLMMSRTKLSSIPWRTAKDKLITFSLDDSVRSALQRLTSNNIVSAPVFDEFGAFWGFTDMQQLVRYVARLATNQTPQASMWNKMPALSSTTIRDLISGYSGRPIYGEYAWPINENASLYQAFERMAREGQHRLAVQDFTGRVVGVLCQSQIINYLNAHISKLGEARKVPVNSIRPYTFVTTVNENSTALSAFQLMDSRLLSHNAVAVVNSSGKLVDVISTHDLRGVLPGTGDFDNLWSTVRTFKSISRGKYPTINILPVTCDTNASLDDVIKLMANKKVHRIFVVNNLGEPIDVITQTDVLRFLLNSVTPTLWW